MIDRWLFSHVRNYKRTSSGNDIRIDCPFCRERVGKDDDQLHMYVNVPKPIVHCFRCGWSGTHAQLVMGIEDCTYSEAIIAIGNTSDVGVYDNIAKPIVEDISDKPCKPDGFVPLSDVLGRPECCFEGLAVLKYARKRGVHRSLYDLFGYVPGTNRIWILVDTHWWQGRLICAGSPKYISPSWSIGASLWNSSALFTCEEIVVCEGIFSAIAAGDNAVALCGKSMNDEQLARIVRASRRGVSVIKVLLDAGAEKEAQDIATTLTANTDSIVHIAYMVEGDPADGVFGDVVEWNWEASILSNLKII